MKILDFIRKNILIVIAVLIIIVIGLYYFIRNYRASKTEYYDSIARGYVYEPIPRNYKVNEYINVNVTPEEMAKTYFNNYMSLMYTNVEEAYLKLDEKDKESNFPTLDSFKRFALSINPFSTKLTQYTTKNINGYLFYILYDEKDNVYIFKTDGVLQYTVSFIDDI